MSKHVVKVFDHGVTPDGKPYMVMEFLAGEPLDQRLDRVGRLSLAETTSIMQQVCRALTRAHDAGIVHRDLKPENIFLVQDDDEATEIAKVVDFGIAKFTDTSKSGLSSSTKTGHVLGTPYYMSPEQARGLRGVDHRSDLWSVGVIAFRALTGRMPFIGEAVGDLLVQICTANAPAASQLAPGIPVSFDAWLQRALAKEPAQRFQTAAELSEALGLVAGIPASLQAPRAAMASAVTVATVQSDPSWPRPIEGVTAAPFTQNALPVKKPTPVALLVGIGAGVLFFIGGAGILVASVASRSSGASGGESAAEVVEGSPPSPTPTVDPPAPPQPKVAASVLPPPSSSAPAEVTEKPAVATKTTTSKTTKTTTTKTGTGKTTTPKTGTPKTGTTKPADTLGY